MSAPTQTSPQAAAATAPAGRRTFAGTATLTRFFLRRDRIRIPIWMVGVVGLVVGSAASLDELLATEADRQSRAALMGSPTMRAFNGPGYGLDDYTIGAMLAHELLVLAAIAVAIMSLLLVLRHTRAEEEAGRAELLRSSIVGAHAVPAAALLVAVVVNLAMGAVMAVALQGAIEDLPALGSWMFGLSMAAVGIVFAAVAALAAQVTEHSRGATGLASIAVGAAFALRAIGDMGGVGDRALSWASPMGWAQSTRAFVDERWWPLLLCVALAVVLAAAALALADRRDVGAGLVRPRPGDPRASEALVRPSGLAWRLHRGSIAAWSVGLAVLGAGFGGVLGEIEAFLDENPQMEEIIAAAEGAGLVESFLATVVVIVVLLAVGFAVSAAMRIRHEERRGRAEPLLATPLSRTRWARGHLVVVLAGSALVTLAGTVGAGVAAALDQGDASLLGDLAAAGVAYVPAVWVTVGLVVVLFGVAPRATGVAWVVLAHAVVVGLLGDVLDLPEAARALSPVHHVGALPAEPWSTAPPLALAAVALVLVGVGLAALTRRDVGAG